MRKEHFISKTTSVITKKIEFNCFTFDSKMLRDVGLRIESEKHQNFVSKIKRHILCIASLRFTKAAVVENRKPYTQTPGFCDRSRPCLVKDMEIEILMTVLPIDPPNPSDSSELSLYY